MKFAEFTTTKGVAAFVVPEQVAAIVDVPAAGVGIATRSTPSADKATLILVCGHEIEVQGSAQDAIKKIMNA